MLHQTLEASSGTGYTGVRLLRLLAQHPNCELASINLAPKAGPAG